MSKEELRSDPLFREMLDDEHQEGIQAMQETAIGMVAESFAKLESLARTKFMAINSLKRLQRLMQDLYRLHTQEEVEYFLLSLNMYQSDGEAGMSKEELRAVPLFRGFLDGERKKGALQTVQEIAIRLVVARFPELEKFARVVVAAVSNVERLQVLVIELSAASSEELAKQLLFSLASDS